MREECELPSNAFQRTRPLASGAPWLLNSSRGALMGRWESGKTSFPAICYTFPMKTFSAVVERDAETGLLVGYVPGFPGAHTQAESLDELNQNLREVIEMLLEDGEPPFEGEFVGTQLVKVG